MVGSVGAIVEIAKFQIAHGIVNSLQSGVSRVILESN